MSVSKLHPLHRTLRFRHRYRCCNFRSITDPSGMINADCASWVQWSISLVLTNGDAEGSDQAIRVSTPPDCYAIGRHKQCKYFKYFNITIRWTLEKQTGNMTDHLVEFFSLEVMQSFLNFHLRRKELVVQLYSFYHPVKPCFPIFLIHHRSNKLCCSKDIAAYRENSTRKSLERTGSGRSQHKLVFEMSSTTTLNVFLVTITCMKKNLANCVTWGI